MQRLVVSLTLCFVFFLAGSGAVYAEKPQCKDDPRACIDGFDENGNVIIGGKAKKTYSFPPIKAGFLVDFYNVDLLPHIGLEYKQLTVPYVGDLAFDVGVATSRAYTSVTWEAIPLIKAGPSVWAGYNVRENSVAFGVGFSILDF